jgi:hypothetical protein
MRRPGASLTMMGVFFLTAVAPIGAETNGSGDESVSRPRPFRIQVVEEGTGRGIPLVELKTVNQIRYVTDSNGIVAFDEPGLFDHKVYFTIKSHGYEVEADGFGCRGAAFQVTEGGSGQVVIRRVNIARRLYRVTGEGIYRDSILTGVKPPLREPLLNGQVFGQDSVLNAVFLGKLYWFWGDTHRPDYPLGNFHVPGAVSELPGHGGLAPEVGVDLSYFVDDHGLARPTAPMPGEGPTWLTGLTVLKDRDGRERMFAVYAKVRKVLEVYERGLAEFNPETERFQKVVTFPPASAHPGEFPDGHPFLHREYGVEYVYYANPYPLIRVPADPAKLKQPELCEAYTCLVPSSRLSEPQLDRGPDGSLRYEWKKNTPLVRQEQQAKLIASRHLMAEEALLNLRDIDSGKTVVAHGGSTYWNPYRNRWAMITVQSFGTSMLGEVWYAEADSPLGPWVYARKIVTHDHYSFYNPKQHPEFDQDNGRIVYFEGTYTTTFSGNPDPTPRYDYNQIMYQLDLSDRRLALPVAVYADRVGRGVVARLTLKPAAAEEKPDSPRTVAFFAPDREGIASLPVYEEFDPNRGQTLKVGSAAKAVDPGGARPLFFVLPADVKDYTAATVPLYEHIQEGGQGRFYSTDARGQGVSPRSAPKLLGRVWRNPAPLRSW